MYKLYFLFVFFGLFSCFNTHQKLDIKKQITDIDYSELKKFQNNIDYIYRLKFLVNDNEAISYGVTKDTQLYKFDSESGITYLLSLKNKLDNNQEISINNNDLYYLNNNSIYIYNLNSKKDTVFIQNAYSDTLFPINQMYNQNAIVSYDNSILFQLGDLRNNFNFTGDFIFAKFHEGKKEEIVPYPAEFKTQYQQYNDVIFTVHDATIFYAFPTIGKVFSYNIKSNSIKNTLIKEGNYIWFDTTKYTDVLYISDYTDKTAYNINIYFVKDYITILQSQAGDNFYLLIFDTELNYITKYKIEHTVFRYYVYSDEEKLYFGVPSSNQLITYNFNEN